MSNSFENLNFHTTEFNARQLTDVIGAIIERVAKDYPEKKLDLVRLRRGLYAAHRTKPIRLIALLHACHRDFPTDVILGVYRHYDPKKDSFKNGWTAQHAEPHTPSFLERLFTVLNGEDDDE